MESDGLDSISVYDFQKSTDCKKLAITHSLVCSVSLLKHKTLYEVSKSFFFTTENQTRLQSPSLPTCLLGDITN